MSTQLPSGLQLLFALFLVVTIALSTSVLQLEFFLANDREPRSDHDEKKCHPLSSDRSKKQLLRSEKHSRKWDDKSGTYPRNLRIALMGDSMTRYMYTSLVLFVHSGRWVLEPRTRGDNNETHVHYHSYKGGMDEFQRATNALFAPYELCDCSPQIEFNFNGSTYEKGFDNRYYWNPETNNSIVYIQAMGNHEKPKGHFAADRIFNTTASSQSFPGKMSPPVWASSWNDTIVHHIAKLNPKPEFLVLNAGHWDNDFPSTKFVVDIMQAVELSGMKGIWKTRTYPRDKKLQVTENNESPAVDEVMCLLLDGCLDLSWTKELNKSDFFDRRHYWERPYQRMNEQLLDYLDSPRWG